MKLSAVPGRTPLAIACLARAGAYPNPVGAGIGQSLMSS